MATSRSHTSCFNRFRTYILALNWTVREKKLESRSASCEKPQMREAQTKNRTMDRPALHTPALPCNDCMRACACCCARMRALGPCASMCLHAHGSTCVCELAGMCTDSQTHLCTCADSSAFLCMCACMRATPCVCESMRNKHCGTCVRTARDVAMFFKQDTTE